MAWAASDSQVRSDQRCFARKRRVRVQDTWLALSLLLHAGVPVRRSAVRVVELYKLSALAVRVGGTHQDKRPRLCPSKGDRSGSRVGGDLLKTSELLELHALASASEYLALSEASAAVSNNSVIKSSSCSCLDMAPAHRSYVHLHYSGPSRYNRKSRRHEKCKDLRLHHQTPLRNL